MSIKILYNKKYIKNTLVMNFNQVIHILYHAKTLKHVYIQLYQSNQTQVLKNNDYRYYQNI